MIVSKFDWKSVDWENYVFPLKAQIFYNNRFEFYEHLNSLQEGIDVDIVLYWVQQSWIECENKASETVRITTELNLQEFEKERFEEKAFQFKRLLYQIVELAIEVDEKEYQNEIKITNREWQEYTNKVNEICNELYTLEKEN